jgi:hypothetical protein
MKGTIQVNLVDLCCERVVLEVIGDNVQWKAVELVGDAVRIGDGNHERYVTGIVIRKAIFTFP